MEYDKEYFQKRIKRSLENYKGASEIDREKMRRTATWMADKARQTDEYFLFFYGSENIFSQWHECRFIVNNLPL